MTYFLILLTAILGMLDIEHLREKKPINKIAWTKLAILVIATILTSISEREKDSKDIAKEAKADERATNITKDIGEAMGKYGLGYDSTKKEIFKLQKLIKDSAGTRITKISNTSNNSAHGLVAINGTGIHDISISGVYDYSTKSDMPDPIISPFMVFELLRKAEKEKNITDKSIYLMFVDGTAGKSFEKNFRQILSWENYTVYGTAHVELTSEIEKGISVTAYKNKIALIVGNP